MPQGAAGVNSRRAAFTIAGLDAPVQACISPLQWFSLTYEVHLPYEDTPNTSYPYNTVGVVSSERSYGSGVLIGTNVVLTAAHLVNGGGRMRFIPGKSGASEPYGSALAVSRVFGDVGGTSGLMSRAESANDYAVLSFSTNFSALGLGYLGIASDYRGGLARIVGYPSGYGQQQQRLDGPVARDLSGAVLNFDGFEVVPGTSGGPLLVGGDAAPSIVGVVSTVAWADMLTAAEYRRIADAIADAARYVTPATSRYNISVLGAEYRVRDAQTGALAAGVPVAAQHVTLAAQDYSFNLATLRDRGLDPALLRDFDGNDLGLSASWAVIGAAALSSSGTLDYILVNTALGRWAEARPDAGGRFNMANFGANGDTRVVGTYMDPLIALGLVVAGGDFDSQRRFSADLRSGRLVVLGGGDYDRNGEVDFIMKINDGNTSRDDDVYLRAIMHADRNIQYANYMNAGQFTSYMSGNGVATGVYEDWLQT